MSEKKYQDLRRYRKYSRQLERESRRLRKWAELMPIGQPFPTFERALLKHSKQPEKKLYPIWLKIRSRTDITKSGKTLWQHFRWNTKEFPPLYSEIEPLLLPHIAEKITCMRQSELLRRTKPQ